MTSYDQIWTTFLNNCKVSDIDLPQTDEQIYEAIRNGILHFNNRLRENLVGDDVSETVNQELSDDYLLILAHYIRLNFLINQRTFFESLWQPFSSDVGLKNFRTQLDSLKKSIEEEERKIERFILNAAEDFL